ncbi:unnamed protein product [Amoebophrya sp. A120]|nr:unnamed protein product [Amoebophrya sp. A120]|eukprot:GSA120T00011212001.1
MDAAEKKFKQSLREMQGSLKQLQDFESKYDELISTLTDLPKKLQHDIMVPFGDGIFFEGHIERTNEVIMHLGDSYYAERTIPNALKTIEERHRENKKLISAQMDAIADLEKERKMLFEDKILEARKIRDEKKTTAGVEKPNVLEREVIVPDMVDENKWKTAATAASSTTNKGGEAARKVAEPGIKPSESEIVEIEEKEGDLERHMKESRTNADKENKKKTENENNSAEEKKRLEMERIAAEDAARAEKLAMEMFSSNHGGKKSTKAKERSSTDGGGKTPEPATSASMKQEAQTTESKPLKSANPAASSLDEMLRRLEETENAMAAARKKNAKMRSEDEDSSSRSSSDGDENNSDDESEEDDDTTAGTGQGNASGLILGDAMVDLAKQQALIDKMYSGIEGCEPPPRVLPGSAAKQSLLLSSSCSSSNKSVFEKNALKQKIQSAGTQYDQATFGKQLDQKQQAQRKKMALLEVNDRQVSERVLDLLEDKNTSSKIKDTKVAPDSRGTSRSTSKSSTTGGTTLASSVPPVIAGTSNSTGYLHQLDSYKGRCTTSSSNANKSSRSAISQSILIPGQMNKSASTAGGPGMITSAAAPKDTKKEPAPTPRSGSGSSSPTKTLDSNLKLHVDGATGGRAATSSASATTSSLIQVVSETDHDTITANCSSPPLGAQQISSKGIVDLEALDMDEDSFVVPARTNIASSTSRPGGPTVRGVASASRSAGTNTKAVTADAGALPGKKVRFAEAPLEEVVDVNHDPVGVASTSSANNPFQSAENRAWFDSLQKPQTGKRVSKFKQERMQLAAGPRGA